MLDKTAVVLLSGGLDSATVLAYALSKGYKCKALSFDYGQRHGIELASARKVADFCGITEHVVINIDLKKWGGSALTSDSIAVPDAGQYKDIPPTYVPARNMIFLSFAAAWAEVLGAREIFIGVNSVDYSGYPDCRPRFIKAFEDCASLGTKAADEGWRFTVQAPLQHLTKPEIIKLGVSLSFDYSLTHSCYNPSPEGRACGRCDSCMIRKRGFEEAGVQDPTLYV